MDIDFHELKLVCPSRPFKMVFENPLEPDGDTIHFASKTGKTRYTLPADGAEVALCRREAGRHDLTVIKVKKTVELRCDGKKSPLRLSPGTYYLDFGVRVGETASE